MVKSLTPLLLAAALLTSSAQNVDTSTPSAQVTVNSDTVITLSEGRYGNQAFTLKICSDGGPYEITFDSLVKGAAAPAALAQTAVPLLDRPALLYPSADECVTYTLGWVAQPGGSYWLVSSSQTPDN